jgi:hypothetical protein
MVDCAEKALRATSYFDRQYNLIARAGNLLLSSSKLGKKRVAGPAPLPFLGERTFAYY